MVTWREVIEKYGDEMAKRMEESGMLSGITITRLPSGEFDIPECDVDRAYRAVNGHPVYGWD